MLHQFSRNELAIGSVGLDVLRDSCVAVLGVGGVGSFAAEALARSGVGKIVLFDKDTIDITNVNRQIHALLSTIGESKCEMMKARIADINRECQVIIHNVFVSGETLPLLFAEKPDFIIDAMDTIAIKCLVIKEALQRNIKIISSMGMANKTDPTQIEILDISKTTYDPIARIVRKFMKDNRLVNKKLAVVCSTEQPVKPHTEIIRKIGNANSDIRKQQIPPSSNAYVPSVAGLFCASYVINTLFTENHIVINHV